jgi:TnpA family transposase
VSPKRSTSSTAASRDTSEIQPGTVHTDTHGQSTPVFALAHLLGINLMPRIRNWKNLRLYRPDREARYQHIDSLFSDSIDWDRIRTHHRDLLQVVLSIRAGRISTPTLLRRLGSYSHRNRLYQAFQELGRVIRTVFLLRWLADLDLRVQVTATTNKVEAFHAFAKWLFFGGDGTTIGDGDPDELEKRVKYNDLVANAASLYIVIAITRALRGLHHAGQPTPASAIAKLSPFITRPIKRFGDYTIPTGTTPAPFDG